MKTQLGATLLLLALSGGAIPAGAESAAAATGATHNYGLSMALTQTSETDSVISYGELATKQNIPKEARKLYEQGIKSDKKGDLQLAMDRMREAVDLAPDFFQAHAALAVGYLKTAELDQAESEADTSLKLNPDYLPGHELKGIVLLFRGNLIEAARTLHEVVRNAPRRVAAHYYLGKALLRTGNLKDGTYHLQRAESLPREPRVPLTDRASRWDVAPSFAAPHALWNVFGPRW